MNPKGLKPTITSNFPKQGVEIDFVSHTCRLSRTPQKLKEKEIMFRMSPFLSKPEIKQYL